MESSTSTPSASGSAAQVELAGWGAYLRSKCTYREVETLSELRGRLASSGMVARGLGRSYGDPALNGQGEVLGLARMNRYMAFDESSGVLRCEAGVTLAQIIVDFAPRGWFPWITPGTKHVTVGGCIANDVHGKAHHAQGSFSESVLDMTILLADGEQVRASRQDNADLFWGTFGGMGLLGIVVDATIRLRPIETTYFRQEALQASCLDEMLDLLEEYDTRYPYSVASIDVLATGARMGRGVLNVGDHARVEELPRNVAGDPLRLGGATRPTVPFELPSHTLNAATIRIVNAAILKIQSNAAPVKHYEMFFYPLDLLNNWNRGYGRRGFTQYQFVIPFENGRANMHAIMSAIFSAGELPFLNILKRLGKGSGGPLSFPHEGYTFAIDFPIRARTVEVLRRLDGMVRDAGGRIYLGKDATLEAAMFRSMYPRVDEFLALKHKYDPRGVFSSDLARRLELVPSS